MSLAEARHRPYLIESHSEVALIEADVTDWN